VQLLVMRCVFTGAADVANRLAASLHCYGFPEPFTFSLCVQFHSIVYGCPCAACKRYSETVLLTSLANNELTSDHYSCIFTPTSIRA